jgi:hypothetical protein
MTLIAWIIVGIAVGAIGAALAGRQRGSRTSWVAAAVVGAFAGGLVGNQVVGTTTVSLSWDVVGMVRSVIDILSGPIELATVLAAGIGAAVASGIVWLLRAPSRAAEAGTY